MYLGNLSALYLFFVSALIVIIFYMLKGRKNEVVFSATFLWKNMIKKNQTKPNWKIKFEPLLILQLLILAILVLALMQPYFQEWGRSQPRVVLVIDRSASMQATDIEPDRFSDSISKAVNIVNEYGDQTEIAVISATAAPELIMNFSDDHQQIVNRLQNLEVTDAEIDIKESLQMAQAMIKPFDEGEVKFFTDGVWELSEDIDLDFSRIDFVQTGSQTGNIGFTELGIRSAYGFSGDYELFVEINNYYKDSREVPIYISTPDQTVISDVINIEAEADKSKQYFLDVAQRTPVKIRLDYETPLESDNILYTVLGQNESLRVLLIGEENFFLKRAFLSLPDVRVFSERNFDPEKQDNYDLLVFNNTDYPEKVDNDTIFINTVPRTMENKIKEEVETFSRVTGWNKNHELFRFIDFSKINTGNFLSLKLPEKSINLASSKAESLIFSREDDDKNWLFITFDLNKSNLPLQVNFPVFLNNAVNWFFPHYFDAEYSNIKTGEIFELPVISEKIDTIVNTEKGIDITGQIRNNHIENIVNTGFYEIKLNNGHTDYFGVNMLSHTESDLQLSGIEERLIIESEKTEDFDMERLQPIWPLFVLIGILLLLLEWFIYCKPQKGADQ